MLCFIARTVEFVLTRDGPELDFRTRERQMQQRYAQDVDGTAASLHSALVILGAPFARHERL